MKTTDTHSISPAQDLKVGTKISYNGKSYTVTKVLNNQAFCTGAENKGFEIKGASKKTPVEVEVLPFTAEDLKAKLENEETQVEVEETAAVG